MKHTLLIKDWLYSFLSLWFPRCCVVCGGSLAKGEECICTMCNINLPRTDYHLRKDNPVEKLFWGKFPLERATSFFFYRKGSDFRQVLHHDDGAARLLPEDRYARRGTQGDERAPAPTARTPGQRGVRRSGSGRSGGRVAGFGPLIGFELRDTARRKLKLPVFLLSALRFVRF